MVQGKRLNRLAAEIAAGHFSIVSGVTEREGGDDEGPTPHELVEAALAACTIITLRMYAARKEMKLDTVDVTVAIESETSQASAISRRIRLGGELSPAERQRLLEIANRCPIHRLLSGEVQIHSELID